ncbi:MAG: transcription termination/antitermination protein NusA [Clostridia bacterium]|nr:transcription termination/antitermination protein NusA [Clostridia bacterium]
MNKEFFEALDLLEKEKGIPKEYMIGKVENALLTAFKREYGGTNVRIFIDENKKEVRVYEQKNVVEEVSDPATEITLADARAMRSKRLNIGDICEFEIKTKAFGRISAQTAKQVIIQGIREAERGMMIKEYESKQDEIITAVVERVDANTGNVIVDTGTSHATLLASEQIPGEVYTPDSRIKVLVTEVKKETRGPLVTLSRIHPGLVRRLFELEVPEIQDGMVVIHGVIREAGSRSKMAVYSKDDNVDPIGACIGNKGMRINRIVEELGGERIDIVKYSEDPAEFIRAALSPAVVLDVEIAEDEHSARVIVAPDQLSLAIGKEGQNARLAARLTGYKIDIKTN